MPSPHGGLPDEGTEPKSLTSLALAGAFFTTNTTWEALRELFARFLPGLGQFSHQGVRTSSDSGETLSRSPEFCLCKSPLWYFTRELQPPSPSQAPTPSDVQAPSRQLLPLPRPGNPAQAARCGSLEVHLPCYPGITVCASSRQCLWTTVSYLFLWLLSSFSREYNLGPSYSILAKSRIFLFQGIIARENEWQAQCKMGK